MYNFDEIIERRGTNAMNTDGFRSYIFHDEKGTMTFPYKDEEFVRMWIADMEFATPGVIIDGIRKRLDARIFGYTRVFGHDYYDAFCGWCRKKYGWEFPQEQLVMSNGIIPALFEMVEYICAPDEKVLFVTPTYAYFKYAADHNARACVCSDLINRDGAWQIDFDDLERKCADPKTTLMFFCNPHNPTGRIWTEEELERVAAIVEKTGSNVIIRDEALREKWLARHYNFDNPLSIAAAQAAYEKGEEWLEELKKYLDANFAFTKEYLASHLPKARFTIPEATYLAWVDLSEYFAPDEDLPDFFAYKAGVLLEGGRMFVQNADGFIRLNLAMPRAMLAEGLKRISESVIAKAAK